MSDKDYGNTLKDFNPLQYYKSRGRKAKQPKNFRRLDNFVPKYIEPKEKRERKRNPELDKEIQKINSELQSKSYVEVMDLSNPSLYMKSIRSAAKRRGLSWSISISSRGGVLIRKGREKNK